MSFCSPLNFESDMIHSCFCDAPALFFFFFFFFLITFQSVSAYFDGLFGSFPSLTLSSGSPQSWVHHHGAGCPGNRWLLLLDHVWPDPSHTAAGEHQPWVCTHVPAWAGERTNDVMMMSWFIVHNTLGYLYLNPNFTAVLLWSSKILPPLIPIVIKRSVSPRRYQILH